MKHFTKTLDEGIDNCFSVRPAANLHDTVENIECLTHFIIRKYTQSLDYVFFLYFSLYVKYEYHKRYEDFHFEFTFLLQAQGNPDYIYSYNYSVAYSLRRELPVAEVHPTKAPRK